MSRTSAIYLFRNDLRLHDNECFNLAHRLADHVIPVYCFDPTHFQPTWHFKFNRTEKFRAKFLIESVQDLKKNLQENINIDSLIL